MAGFITKKLIRIIDGIHGFEQGNPNARFKILSRNELGTLSVAFNTTTDKLKSNIVELKLAQTKPKKLTRYWKCL